MQKKFIDTRNFVYPDNDNWDIQFPGKRERLMFLSVY